MARGLEIEYTDLTEHACLSPQYSIGVMDGGKSTRVFLIGWQDMEDAVKQLLGYSWVDDTTLKRRLPAKHPTWDWLVATNISRIEGVGKPTKVDVGDVGEEQKINEYPKAKLTVEYTRPLVDYLEDDEIDSEFDRYTTVSSSASGQYLTVPSFGVLKFSDGPSGVKGKSFPGNVGRTVPLGEYCIGWMQIPYDHFPDVEVNDLIGRVNKADFGSNTDIQLFFPAGTLLLCGAHKTLHIQPDGTFAWNVEYQVQYDRKGHNNLFSFRPSPGGFYQVAGFNDGDTVETLDLATVEDGRLIYNPGDFDRLFQVVE